LAAYDPVRAKECVDQLVLPLVSGRPQARAVVVANSPEAYRALEPRMGDSRLRVLQGTNAEAEFSAYDQALADVVAGDGESGAVIVLNDRALSYGDDYRHSLRGPVLSLVVQHDLISGSIESFFEPVSVAGGRVLTTWCRTNFLLTSASVLRKLAPLTTLDAPEFARIAPVAYPGPAWRPEALGSDRYWGLVRSWLTVPGNWYRAQVLDEQTWPVFRAKLLAIVNEHLLSARAQEAGVTLIGYRQLALVAALARREELLAEVLAGYRRLPYMGDDRHGTPSCRALRAAGVVAGSVHADALARFFLRQAEAECERRGPPVSSLVAAVE
jgi:hypothetical protein